MTDVIKKTDRVRKNGAATLNELNMVELQKNPQFKHIELVRSDVIRYNRPTFNLNSKGKPILANCTTDEIKYAQFFAAFLLGIPLLEKVPEMTKATANATPTASTGSVGQAAQELAKPPVPSSDVVVQAPAAKPGEKGQKTA